jgi:predicted metal-dependent hydrolase
MYPNIPSHYVHGVCQDAVERVSSLRRNKARQYSREIFNELVKYLGLGKRDLRGREDQEISLEEILGDSSGSGRS